MATTAKGRTLDYPLSPSFSPLSLSVSRVIKDCTLINFSALLRAKCPGRELCVCARVCLCACAHVHAPGFVMYASLVLEYIPVIHSAVFTFALKCESVCVCLCLYESNTIFPLTFYFRPFSLLNLSAFHFCAVFFFPTLTASKKRTCTNSHQAQVKLKQTSNVLQTVSW